MTVRKSNGVGLAFAAAAFALPGHGATAAMATAASRFPLPACTAADGQSVQYIEGDRVPVQEFAAASTYGAPFTPVIIYNPAWMEGAPEPVRILTALHECTHHRLDHVRQTMALIEGGAFDYAARLKIEEDADCGAAKAGRRDYHYGAAELKAYFDYMRQTTPEKIHPTIKLREDATMQCFAAP